MGIDHTHLRGWKGRLSLVKTLIEKQRASTDLYILRWACFSESLHKKSTISWEWVYIPYHAYFFTVRDPLSTVMRKFLRERTWLINANVPGATTYFMKRVEPNIELVHYCNKYLKYNLLKAPLNKFFIIVIPLWLLIDYPNAAIRGRPWCPVSRDEVSFSFPVDETLGWSDNL